MSKILVIDDFDSIEDCPCSKKSWFEGESVFYCRQTGNYRCGLDSGNLNECPLKDIPDKEARSSNWDAFEDGWSDGWNSFRDYILGDKTYEDLG